MSSEQQQMWIVSIVALVAIVAMVMFAGNDAAPASYSEESNMGGMGGANGLSCFANSGYLCCVPSIDSTDPYTLTCWDRKSGAIVNPRSTGLWAAQ